jgi:hypothetical protein
VKYRRLRASPRTVFVLAEGTTENVLLVNKVFGSALHLLCLYFALEREDAEKDVRRGTALTGEPTLEIVGPYVELQSDLRIAVVVDHIADGSYVEFSVGIHAKKHSQALCLTHGIDGLLT